MQVLEALSLHTVENLYITFESPSNSTTYSLPLTRSLTNNINNYAICYMFYMLYAIYTFCFICYMLNILHSYNKKAGVNKILLKS